jgi:ribulose-phosphate 3-epimerase
MATITPTITAYDAHEYRDQMEAIESFAERVHIDLMDGKFAPTVSPGLDKVWWPENLTTDIHLMFEKVEQHLEKLIELKPSLVIIHAEVHCQNDLPLFAASLREAGIKCGVAFLPETKVEAVSYLLPHMQHALVFSGKLGYHGGSADLKLLDKVQSLKKAHPWLEVSWDGGISDQNARQLVDGGVDVLNVGGFIQKSENPKENYQKLIEKLA